MLAAVSFYIGVTIGKTTASGGGNAPEVRDSDEAGSTAPKRVAVERSDKGLTYSEFRREAPPSYLKWVRDTACSQSSTCRGLRELHDYLIAASEPPVEEVPSPALKDGSSDGGNASARQRNPYTYV